MAKNNKKGGEGKMMVAAAAGAAAVGAGAYYLFGPNGKANQKKAKAIAEKIKKEAVQEYKKAKNATMPVYHKAVDAISENYAKQYNLHSKDIKAIAQKIKGEWKDISAKTGKTTTKARKVAAKKIAPKKVKNKKA